jgi:RNA polymerase sigma factor (sigma-70 family)
MTMPRRYDDDAQLVMAARDGDGEAFTTLFRRWFDPCVEVARRIVHDPETAAEVAQETFLVAWRQLGSLRDPASFGGWVLRTARNKALNRLDRERRSTPVDQLADPVVTGLEAVDDVAADVAGADQQQLLWAASAALGERDASVLDLHLRHGFDAAEIAEALDVTPNNAHQLLFRMKGRLATAIRAWVLYKGGDPACPDLRRALVAAGATTFSAATVKVIDRHVDGCDDCGRRRAAILAPEALFASVPILPVAVLVRQGAAEALRDSGVPLGPDAATPLGAAEGAGEAPDGDAPDVDPSDVDAPDGDADGSGPGPTAVAAVVASGSDRRRVLLAALAGLVLLVGVGLFLALRSGDETAGSEEAPATTEATVARSATAPSTTAPVSVAPPSTAAPAPSTTTTTSRPPSTTATTTAPPVVAPTIASFAVTPPSAPGSPCAPGQWPFSLTWTTTEATSVAITSPAGVAPVAGGPNGTATGCALSPGASWTLVATGPGGSASATR